MGFPCSSVGKESACSAGDLGLIPGLGRAPGEGNGNPLQYPCLENLIYLMDRGAWWAAVHGVTKSRAQLTNTYLLTQWYLRLAAHDHEAGNCGPPKVFWALPDLVFSQ